MVLVGIDLIGVVSLWVLVLQIFVSFVPFVPFVFKLVRPLVIGLKRWLFGVGSETLTSWELGVQSRATNTYETCAILPSSSTNDGLLSFRDVGLLSMGR